MGAVVLGSPIAHSLSPALHQAAYDALGLDGWHYRAIECTEAELYTTLQALDAEGLAGASLTMPLKRAVVPMVSSLDVDATTVGAANTVTFGDHAGRWSGANTDVAGMVTALSARQPARGAGQLAAVLGAGATAASAIAALSQLGVKDVTVFARRPARGAALASFAESIDVDLEVRRWDELVSAGSAALVISTTPAASTIALTEQVPDQPGLLFDVIYSPWPTPLAAAWQAAGGQVIGGLELLVEQAAVQVTLMTGQAAPVAAMREAGYAALRRA
jgi:shikimate dehydrogenase